MPRTMMTTPKMSIASPTKRIQRPITPSRSKAPAAGSPMFRTGSAGGTSKGPASSRLAPHHDLLRQELNAQSLEIRLASNTGGNPRMEPHRPLHQAAFRPRASFHGEAGTRADAQARDKRPVPHGAASSHRL